MRIPTIALILLYSLGLVSCSSDQGNKKSYQLLSLNKTKKSRVINFNYDGYSDTICALVYGSVYEIDSSKSDSLKGIEGVTIKVDQTGEAVSTDEKGEFVMGFSKGLYSLTITKPGFQMLKLTNYVFFEISKEHYLRLQPASPSFSFFCWYKAIAPPGRKVSAFNLRQLLS